MILILLVTYHDKQQEHDHEMNKKKHKQLFHQVIQ